MEKLRQYLKVHSERQRDFSARVGISRSYLSEIISGRKRPGLDLVFDIDRATGGEVPASAWDLGGQSNSSISQPAASAAFLKEPSHDEPSEK